MPVRKASFGLSVALLCSIFYLVLHYLTNLIYNAVNHSYIDEIFHIPQAQLYCRGNLTYYDPKITTPPGLYFMSYARIWIRDKVIVRRPELVCDIIDLRRTNHLVAISNFVVINLIQLSSGNRVNLNRKDGLKERIFHTMDQSTTLDLAKIILTSIAITILPPLFFFNSLYYTDPGSLLFTLTTYLFSINNHHLMASLFGIISITFRQTNIVWVFYSACLVILKTFDESLSNDDKKAKIHNQSVGRKTYCYRDILFNKSLIVTLLKRCTPYAIVGILFIIFVALNNGIVLGDKESHQAKLHFAQILYFLGFCSTFGASWIFHLRILRRFLYFTIRSPVTAMIATALIIYLIAFGRYAHPYLLADNRHITFYIWRRILDRHNSYVPYLLTPIYLISSLSVWHHLRQKGCKRMLLYVFCTLLVIVPNGLLEPRYFIVPYIFLRLSTESSVVVLLLEIGQNLLINLGMYYLFLFKTFRWADSNEVQRIMW